MKQSFETFAEVNSNRFATVAAKAVANVPGNIYNPFYVYGSAGLGKTHLLNAIGDAIAKTDPNAEVKLMTAEEFTNSIINAIQTSTVKVFQYEIRTVDCLIIDDIQFLEDKERTQEELFYTISALKEANRQVVIAGNCHPRFLHLEERLCSRIESGLTVEIKPPDCFERMNIIRKMSETENMNIPNEVVQRLAFSCDQNIHMIVGELNRIKAYANLMHLPIDMKSVNKALDESVPGKDKTTCLSLEEKTAIQEPALLIDQMERIVKKCVEEYVGALGGSLYIRNDIPSDIVVSALDMFSKMLPDADTVKKDDIVAIFQSYARGQKKCFTTLLLTVNGFYYDIGGKYGMPGFVRWIDLRYVMRRINRKSEIRKQIIFSFEEGVGSLYMPAAYVHSVNHFLLPLLQQLSDSVK